MLYFCYLFSGANIKLFFQLCNIFFLICLNNVATESDICDIKGGMPKKVSQIG